MTIFPRDAEDHHSENYRDRAWAHRILDLYRAGEAYERDTIDNALRITGDLLAAGRSGRESVPQEVTA